MTTRSVLTSTLLALTICIAGCRDVPVASINGVASTDTAIEYDRIVGTWVVVPEPPEEGEEPKEERRQTFIDVLKENGEFTLVIRRGIRRDSFIAHIIEIGEQRYLDAQQRDIRPQAGEDKYSAPHHFFKITEHESVAFRIEFLSQDWLFSEHEAGRLDVPHTVTNEIVVLTATPDELRDYLILSEETPEAWAPLGSHIVPAKTE